MPKNYEPGNSTDFSGLLLGCCWRCKNWHHTTVPCHIVTLCTEHCRTQAGYHSLALFVCSIFLANPWVWTESLTGVDTGWRYSVFSFKLCLNWTMLLCLASWSLPSSTGAWLLTQSDEAKGNELDRPGRQNTAHALPSSFWEKRQQRPPDHFSQYTHSSSELLPCPFMSAGTNCLYEPFLLLNN